MYLYLTEQMNIDPSRIVLYGRSIGSGPTCYLAEKFEVAGVVLHSPLMSAARVVFNLRWTLPFDKFPNIDRVPNIECPIYIVHGRRDEIVPFYHAIELHQNSKHKYNPYYVDGAGHNNIEKFAIDYLPRIKSFLEYLSSRRLRTSYLDNGVDEEDLTCEEQKEIDAMQSVASEFNHT